MGWLTQDLNKPSCMGRRVGLLAVYAVILHNLVMFCYVFFFLQCLQSIVNVVFLDPAVFTWPHWL